MSEFAEIIDTFFNRRPAGALRDAQRLTEHYKWLFEKFSKESNTYQAQLFHSWTVIRQQNKGLQRQRRLIKRLQRDLAMFKGMNDALHKANDHLAGKGAQPP